MNSDFPGESLNPFFGMYAAETRESPDGFPVGGWYPKQRLTRAAYSGFEEIIKGKIVKGMLADFIILSDDIMTISSKDLLDLRVNQTYVSGKLKYRNK